MQNIKFVSEFTNLSYWQCHSSKVCSIFHEVCQ